MNERDVPDNRTSRNSRKKVQPVLYVIAAVLSLIGLADAIYLTVEHLVGETAGCIVSSSCFEVLGSKYARVGPVPLAAFGSLAYFAAFGSAILAAFEYRGFQTLLMLLVQAMFAITLWLLLVQAFILHAFCDYCLFSAAVTLTLTGIVFAAHLLSPRNLET